MLNAGQSFQLAIFRMFKHVWNIEKRPKQWKFTEIIQLFKGKGESDDLSNYRHIHLKDYLPKAFETGLVDRSKNKIMEACSKFQIGAMSGHQSQEHLYTLKSTISLYTMLDIALIIQFYDI